MPVFQVRIINRDFDASNEIEANGPEAARSQAMKGALQIGTDEVLGGKPFFGAEVRINDGDNTVDRMVIAVGVTQLRIDGQLTS